MSLEGYFASGLRQATLFDLNVPLFLDFNTHWFCPPTKKARHPKIGILHNDFTSSLKIASNRANLKAKLDNLEHATVPVVLTPPKA